MGHLVDRGQGQGWFTITKVAGPSFGSNEPRSVFGSALGLRFH